MWCGPIADGYGQVKWGRRCRLPTGRAKQAYQFSAGPTLAGGSACPTPLNCPDEYSSFCLPQATKMDDAERRQLLRQRTAGGGHVLEDSDLVWPPKCTYHSRRLRREDRYVGRLEPGGAGGGWFPVVDHRRASGCEGVARTASALRTGSSVGGSRRADVSGAMVSCRRGAQLSGMVSEHAGLTGGDGEHGRSLHGVPYGSPGE